MKRIFIALSMAACITLTGCSNVSQENYNKLLEENAQFQSKIETLSAEKSALEQTVASLESENAELTADNEILENRNAYLKQQLAENTDSQSKQEPSANKTVVNIYEDDYISLSYVGFGTGASYPFEERQCIIFEAENKTDGVIGISPTALSLDGYDVGALLCREKISPQSKGKIYLLKESNINLTFDNLNPTKISGSLELYDSNGMGLFPADNSRYHTISFIDVSLAAETGADESNSIDQAQDKLPPVVEEHLQTGGQYEAFVTEDGNEWFVCLDLGGGLAATYLNTDNTTENINNAYSDILSLVKEYPSALMIMLCWYNSDNECVGMTALTNFASFGLTTIYISDNRIAWAEECSDYNENEANITWIKSWEEYFPCPTDTE